MEIKVQEGSCNARQKMISSNRRLVINQAKKYAASTQSLTLRIHLPHL